ncbi:MAG: hypothetical protein DMG47_00490 [Acidobacteria bacterium]|nr:MAG: hypothetical protein DMG47_00490 [Acidobacteriota bacterium]
MKGRIDESTADGNKNRAEQDCSDSFYSSKISAADDLRVDEGEACTRKWQSEESQEGGSALRRLGHSLILESFERTKQQLQAKLLLRLYLNAGTGLAFHSRQNVAGSVQQPSI